ncbi:hypothetical protein Syun_007724 [Stephania yunnanensis]|uniref:Kinesin-like protein KIN-1 n=1 Tax=Stephania yunnanensis TaxID=152371 RepID=A0AAP0KZ11_9MAGN
MSSVTVCARFRPLNSKERRDHGDSPSCIQSVDSENFIFKDGKEEESMFCFDRVFYQESLQSDVYDFLARPIIQDVVNAISGTIITYGQTGAGKTYSMEGPSILENKDQNKGLLPRVVEGLFECLKLDDETIKYTVKLSMVEIYMEKVRDLLDLSKDNLQIKECKVLGVFLSGVTEISITDAAEALVHLSNGISNRTVGETQMNMESSRSHCAYIFTVQQESVRDTRLKTGKLILLDLAGSEKIEKTGAEGKILEEAKTINKSLSALGNVINALTDDSPGRVNHIPYRDSKITRILRDALGGPSRTALLLCCSPSPSNAAESLSTLRFGTRAKHIKSTPRGNRSAEKVPRKQLFPSPTKDESCQRILDKLSEKMKIEDVKLLEELFIMEGIISIQALGADSESVYEDVTLKTITTLQQAVEEQACVIKKLKRENRYLKAKLLLIQGLNFDQKTAERHSQYFWKDLRGISSFLRRILEFMRLKKMSKLAD